MFYPKPATNPAWAAADVWVGFNYTYDPAAATNKISIALWREALETEETTIFVHSSSSGIDALVDGSRIGFGSHPGDSGSLIDWLTIGTDGDDADTAPIGPAERQRSRLILTPW
ncbi:hypothetical protein C664_01315 [Thauera sp. 63]|nr:hypothetical protein C664_01315 [Thauera sp. 63]